MSKQISLEKTIYISELYDFYKKELTEKQCKYFELYFLEDLTLQEIADEFGVSRSAILDSLEKTVKILERLESNLGIHKLNLKFRELTNKLKYKEISVDDFLAKIDGEL